MTGYEFHRDQLALCVALWSLGLLAGCASGSRLPPNSTNEAATRSYELTPSRGELQTLEREVLQHGHQPWRLEPLRVAQAALAEILTTDFGLPEATADSIVRDDRAWSILALQMGRRTASWKHDNAKAQVGLRNSQRESESGIWYTERVIVVGLPPRSN